MVGVSDSKSLAVPVDVLKEGLDDDLLSEVCSIKSAGSALTTLGALGESDSFTSHGWHDIIEICFQSQEKVNIACSMVLSQ